MGLGRRTGDSKSEVMRHLNRRISFAFAERMNSWALMVALIGKVVVVASMAEWFELHPEYQPDNQKVIALPDTIYSQENSTGWDVTVCTISVFL
jgi:hypothetical protein